jgi:putative Holliday junction resolvase
MNGLKKISGRYMAFDYGSKRLGIAVTDPEHIIATALITIHPRTIISFLTEYLKTELVSAFIIGQPVQLNNEPSEITPQVEAFINLIKKNFSHIPILRIDERFTSKMANQAVHQMGLRKKSRHNKSLIDKISATLILQSYLEFESWNRN